jgi:hypothetical protein
MFILRSVLALLRLPVADLVEIAEATSDTGYCSSHFFWSYAARCYMPYGDQRYRSVRVKNIFAFPAHPKQ